MYYNNEGRGELKSTLGYLRLGRSQKLSKRERERERKLHTWFMEMPRTIKMFNFH